MSRAWPRMMRGLRHIAVAADPIRCTARRRVGRGGAGRGAAERVLWGGGRGGKGPPRLIRRLGRTDIVVPPIGFGAWAIGGFWGAVDDEASMRALHAAVDAGVTFIDTADVYGDGRSERLIGRLLRERPREGVRVAKEAG